MLRLPSGISREAFLADYWQRAPLLMRQAISLPSNVIEPDELAGLACEAGTESRILIEHGGTTPWEVRHGPFGHDDFTSLPDSHWTLLVQDVDKHVPEVAEVLSWFRFVPDWRIDDIMISYAADQGSVGPHTDDYDVFLIQAQGRRRWRIHQRPVKENDLIPGIELRILKHFDAEQDWVLEPGDVLYLPPGVAHWGVAEGECMTWSVGFRAPSSADLASSWVDDRLATMTKTRYRDPPLSPPTHPGEIPAAAVKEAKRLVEVLLTADNDDFTRWLCAFASEPKEYLAPVPADQPATVGEVRRLLCEGIQLHRHPAARLLFHSRESDVVLAASGGTHLLPPTLLGLAHRITDLPPGGGGDFGDFAGDPAALELLTELYNEGQLEIIDD